MLRDKIIIAGSGGQGALRIGQMIALAGLDEGKDATWIPSYGAEMRGGTANCSVIISKDDIAFPMVSQPDYCIVMNFPSLLKFEKEVRPGGTLIVNSSLIPQRVQREDLQVHYIPADSIAEEEGNPRGTNMVLLGAYIAVSGCITIESIYHIIDRSFTGSKAKYAQSNKKLVKRGFNYIEQSVQGETIPLQKEGNMGKVFKLFVINPGSTSTRVAYFENEKQVHNKKLVHPTEVIAQYKEINDQFEMRKKMVEEYIEEIGIKELDCIVSRGGGGRPLRCGGYGITPLMVEECKRAPWPHASNLGVMIAFELMSQFRVPGYIYDAPLADDFCEYAKVSGLPELPTQRGAGHPLNEKAAGWTIAKKKGGRYEEYNFIICHLGGGITVNAHQKGKIIDSHINAFSPERSGALPIIGFTKMCFSGKWETVADCIKRQMGNGGLVAYLGTSDVLEVERRIESGDQEAEFYFQAMIYQIAKDIGGIATVMDGQVDNIILTGEIAHSKRLTDSLTKRVEFIAPVEVVPGAVEMDALVQGVLRMLRGEEPTKEYDTEQA